LAPLKLKPAPSSITPASLAPSTSGPHLAPLGAADATDAPDAPSFIGALEKQLGIKIVPAKDPIEVLVIDSIDRPRPTDRPRPPALTAFFTNITPGSLSSFTSD